MNNQEIEKRADQPQVSLNFCMEIDYRKYNNKFSKEYQLIISNFIGKSLFPKNMNLGKADQGCIRKNSFSYSRTYELFSLGRQKVMFTELNHYNVIFDS